MRIRTKICCIQNVHEAGMAIRLGADALGFVSTMPSGPGPIPETRIRDVAARIPPPIATFLLTSRQDTLSIIGQQNRCCTNAIQLVDRLDKGTYEDFRVGLPGVSIIQVVHVTGSRALAEAQAVESFVDAVLLDSGSPGLEVKELGGTGRTHNWEISREIREKISKPVILAGGLNPENVVEAIQTVRPFMVDVCSGVRTEGRLDEEKLSAFLSAVHSV